MTVSTPTQPDYTTQDGSTYRANIDGAIHVAARSGWPFAVHQTPAEWSPTGPDMHVQVAAGHIPDGSSLAAEIPAQELGPLSAPVANPRNDIVVIDRTTGGASVIAGAEAASPSDPLVTAGKVPLARVRLTVGMTEITNTDINDLRPLFVPAGTAAVRDIGTSDGDVVMVQAGGKLPELDGSALTGLAAADPIARDMAVINAWEIARIDGRPFHASVSTVIDVFTDETGVNTGASANQTYDSVGDYYSPSRASVIAAYDSANQNGGFGMGQGGVNSQQVGEAITLAETEKVGAIKWYVRRTNNGTGNAVAKIYAATGAMGTDAVPTGSVLATSANVDISTLSASYTMVEFTFADLVTLTAGDYALLIEYTGPTDGGLGAGSDNFPPADARNNFATLTAGSGWIARTEAMIFELSGVGDMAVRSQTITAASAPSSLRPVFDVEEIDAATENVDFMGDVTRDGGATWSTVALAQISGVSGNRAVWAADVDVSGQPSGVNVEIRFRTANRKDIRLHRWAVQTDVAVTI